MGVKRHQLTDVMPGVLNLADARFEGRDAFRGMLRNAIERATQYRWQHAVFCDADFADWPLGERAVEAALDAWAHGGTRFTIIAQRYDEVLHRHARFVHWRTRWSHQVDCRQTARVSQPTMPSLFWTENWVLHRTDPARSVCVACNVPARRVATRELINQVLRTASPAFAPTTLGL